MRFDGALVMGELSLDGVVRHVRGVLSVADMARHYGSAASTFPRWSPGSGTHPRGDGIPGRLAPCAGGALQGAEQIAPLDPGVGMVARFPPPTTDFAEIQGQEHAKRAF
jgi:magnesium chelatase family protein